MKPDGQKNSGKEFKVQEKFDQILGRHMDRLIGTKYGIEGLPINSMNVSGLILLMERENEIENLTEAESERYTPEVLCQELEEMGFDPGQDLDMAIQEMKQKGYVRVEDGRLIPQKPAASMTQLVDKTFPKMPGMNLVAYFIQTMDEVHSERKDLETAAKQFDQMMQMQGVPLKRGRTQPQKGSPPSPKTKDRLQNSDAQPNADRQISSEEGLKPRNILGRQKVVDFPQGLHAFTSESKVLSSDASKSKVKIRAVDFGRTSPVPSEPEEIASVQGGKIESQKAESHTEVTDKKKQSEADAAKDHTDFDASVLPRSSSSLEVTADVKVEDQGVEEISEFQEEAPEVEDTKDERDIDTEDEVLEKTDEDIARTIAAFEEGLAMECPMCRQSKVQTKNTAKNKVYYKCSNKACNFISWGKPYHIPCPQCNNPFLVEASDKAGKSIFKCPRATCRYWQRPPWEISDKHQERISSASNTSAKVTAKSRKPRKKVVRRRRVRRKK